MAAQLLDAVNFLNHSECQECVAALESGSTLNSSQSHAVSLNGSSREGSGNTSCVTVLRRPRGEAAGLSPLRQGHSRGSVGGNPLAHSRGTTSSNSSSNNSMNRNQNSARAVELPHLESYEFNKDGKRKNTWMFTVTYRK